MSPSNTVVAGSQPKRWPTLGGTTGTHITPPSSCTGLLVGLPGEGKSALFQSHPDAFLLNLDQSSTTTPTVRASIWPLDNEPLTWAKVLDRKKTLISMSSQNEDRPKTVIVDSLSACLQLVKPWVVKNAVELKIASEPKTHWNDLHGPAAWDETYNQIVNLLLDLKQAGYGVWFAGHVVNAKVPIGEDQFALRPELTITDGFWKRLYYIFEFVGYVTKEAVTEEYEQKDPRTGRSRKKTRTRTVHLLTADKLPGITKSRTSFTSMTIPREDAWVAFETAYLQAPE